MRFFLFFLMSVATVFSFSPQKQALIDFEMGSYFLQGQDFENAEKYLLKAQDKLAVDELEVVLARNLAQIYLMKEEKKKLFSVLEKCIEKADDGQIKDSQALREIYQLYARLKADEINPAIMNALLQRRQQQMQEAIEKQQKQRPVINTEPEKSTATGKPRLGF